MPLKTPTEVRKSFARDSAITKDRIPIPKAKNKRVQRTNFWPGGKLNYEYLESCKETVCRIKHPTGYYKYRDSEYRVSIMRWSRGSYVDIRMYSNGIPRPMGILLHIDIISAMMPELLAAVRKLEIEDDREPDKKARVEVIVDEDRP